ncbi:MAG TPA: glycine--tRNA ligase subunit beta [Acidobacteriaceae bacterium]|jgi:glycyl-tRNA synthetase beta chain|nr:glycine--tRNA ligase subunit beta [Acidobacteriaceae bacterium]
MSAFLLEIGLEEIPARMIAAAQKELAERVEKLLTRERLLAAAHRVQSYSTPRRLAVVVEGVLAQQPDVQEELVGPSRKVAYKDGMPTPAAVAFAKKAGVEVTALKTVTNAKGEYIGATVEREGKRAADVLAAELPREIASLYWVKSMYWRAGKPERFVRPVRWIVALLDGEVVPVEFAGVQADGLSYGHRVLYGDAPVVISAPSAYVAALESAKVIVDVEARRHKIRKDLDAATRTLPDARWRENEELVDTVTHLTEWPTVLLGSFEKEYLTLPDEILVTVMRDHQKYFALEDANKKLLPNFLAVLNTEVDAAGAAIIRHGNERVLRARFNDARFFWDVDQKIPLVDRVEMLKNVTFHKDLGSYWEKTQKNLKAADYISKNLSGYHSEEWTNIRLAVELAKADLTTEMVKEFTELQGIVGGLYVREQGLPKEVAIAIYQQYRPQSSNDEIPTTKLAALLAIADKITTITEMFKKDIVPTGSKDPFALRRAGAGVVRILVENAAVRDHLHLIPVIHAANQTMEADKDLRFRVFAFMLDRLEFYLQESCGVRLQVARAVRNSGAVEAEDDSPGKLVGYGYVAGFARVLHEQTGSPDVVAVAELLKRAANIQRQAREKGINPPDMESPSLLHDPAEKELARQVTEVNAVIQKNYREGKYNEVISAIASLQSPLNAFFDSVMVMVDDEKLRDNRLALLARTVSVVRWAADFSELASISTVA